MSVTNPNLPGSLLLYLRHPSGEHKVARLAVAADVPDLPHLVRTSAHVFTGYARAGWVLEAVHGVYFDAYGCKQVRPLETLLVVIAQVVGPHHVLRPVKGGAR